MSRRKTTGLLNQVLNLVYSVADKVGLPENYLSVFARSEKKVEINIPFTKDDGTIVNIPAYKVQHSTVSGPSLGSISVSKNLSLDDCEALAMLSTIHNSMFNLPLGGSKSVIVADPKDFSEQELQRLYKKFLKTCGDMFSKNSDLIKLKDSSEESKTKGYILGEIAEQYKSIESVVNRPAEFYGTGMDCKSQSFSIAHSIKEVLKKFCEKDMPDIKVGLTLDEDNPDLVLLIELGRMGLKIEGFNTEIGTNLCSSKIWDIIHNHPWDFNNSIKVKDCNPFGIDEEESILTADVDVLILQSDKYRITSDIAEEVKAKYIIEAEENLITAEAEAILEDRNIVVIPDFISLGGILINSYIDHLEGLGANLISEEEFKRIVAILVHSNLEKIWLFKDSTNLTTKEAAIWLAIDRVLNKMSKIGV